MQTTENLFTYLPHASQSEFNDDCWATCMLPHAGWPIIHDLQNHLSSCFRYQEGLIDPIIPGSIILARHGSIDGLKEGIVVGVTDVSLNDQGRQEAVNAANQIANLSLEQYPLTIITSPLQRAQETTSIIVNKLKQEKIDYTRALDSRLMAQNFGPLENNSFKDLSSSPHSMHLYENIQSRYHPFVRAGNNNENLGESCFDVLIRVAGVMEDLHKTINNEQAQYTLIVTHGSIIKTMNFLLRNRGSTDFKEWDEYHIPHGSLATLLPTKQ
jgi:broad specificity phosphatase PhoE